MLKADVERAAQSRHSRISITNSALTHTQSLYLMIRLEIKPQRGRGCLYWSSWGIVLFQIQHYMHPSDEEQWITELIKTHLHENQLLLWCCQHQLGPVNHRLVQTPVPPGFYRQVVFMGRLGRPVPTSMPSPWGHIFGLFWTWQGHSEWFLIHSEPPAMEATRSQDSWQSWSSKPWGKHQQNWILNSSGSGEPRD